MPDENDPIPPEFIAKADQWSAFIRNWVIEIQRDGYLSDAVSDRMFVGIAELCPDEDDRIPFAMHLMFALAFHVNAADLEFP